MLWDPDRLRVFLDISTFCNAGCPQCHRTDPNGLGKADWLPLIQWDLKMFQKAFPPKEVLKINRFNICGTFGDPIMTKDFMEICQYIVKCNPFAEVSVDTNGSIRDETWWWLLGAKIGKSLKVTFDVDGINQEMHSKYRRFTSLEKVLANMQALSSTNAVVSSQTILFKHNQNYKEEIKQLVLQYGSTNHSFVVSDRFDKHSSVDGKRYFIDENGNEDYLEEADPESVPNGVITGTQSRTLKSEIKCLWALPRNEVVINPDGQVLPCCFHGNSHYRSRMLTSHDPAFNENVIYSDGYNKDLKSYNVFHTPLSEIIRSEWYTKTLPDSMKGDNPVRQCVNHCSSRINKTHQLRENQKLVDNP